VILSVVSGLRQVAEGVLLGDEPGLVITEIGESQVGKRNGRVAVVARPVGGVIKRPGIKRGVGRNVIGAAGQNLRMKIYGVSVQKLLRVEKTTKK